MSAAYELAAWFTFVGAILGAAGMALIYERLLQRAQDDHDADLAANDAHQKKVTAEAVAKVRREADAAGYRHGWADCQARWRDSWEQQTDAQGSIRRHLYAVNDWPGHITDAELADMVYGEDS